MENRSQALIESIFIITINRTQIYVTPRNVVAFSPALNLSSSFQSLTFVVDQIMSLFSYICSSIYEKSFMVK